MAFSLPTKQNVIDSFLRRHPQAGQAWAVELFDSAMTWVFDHAELRFSDITVDLVAGDNEYDLPSNVASVEWANYHASATDIRRMGSMAASDLTGYVYDGVPYTYMVISKADTAPNTTKRIPAHLPSGSA
jgi:hypothetical protein